MSRTANSQCTFGLCRNLILIAVFSLLLCGMLAAQVTSGTIYGSIKDPSGALVPKASVVVRSAGIGVERTVTSSDSGAFVVPNLPPSTYAVTVTAQGFKKFEKQGLVLSATDRLNAGEFVLQVGTADSAVTVTADSAEMQLQANSGERSDLITDNQLKNLALNGRNVLDFVKVVPGVVSTLDGSTSNRAGLDQFNVNGTRANQHQYTIDGTSNVDTGNNGAMHVTINPDAIAEVKVLTSNYQAEYGKAAGGTIAVTTKGGTSDFHGNARWFHRHEGLNANEYFNKQDGHERPLYRYNYMGYQIGGPVLIPGTDFNKDRKKLFFFWNQEYYRQLIPGSRQTAMVPTSDVLNNYDFSKVVDGAGNAVTITDPVTGLPFAGNKIPANRINQAVLAYLKLYPQPNVSGRTDYNYSQTASTDYPRREDILRVDYQLNEANRIYGRWINNASKRNEPYGSFLWGISNIPFPGGMDFEEPGWNTALNWTSTISNTLINEFSIGASVAKLRADGHNGNISRAKNPAINIPLLYSVSSDTPISDLQMDGIWGLGQQGTWAYMGAMPFNNANTTIDLSDNLTKVLGKHIMKYGVNFQRSRKDQSAWGNVNGEFHFQNNPTGHAWASALLGYYDHLKESTTRPRGFFRYTNLEWYAQDTYKVTPRLTLDYGMRFTWFQPQYDAQDQISMFNPALYNPADKTSTTNGMGQASKGYPEGGFDNRGVMFGPRVGFAYSLTGDAKTVLRGGFGIVYDRIQGNLIFNPVFENPPNSYTSLLYNGNLSNLTPSGAVSGLVSMTGAAKSGEVPNVYNFSLGIQREIGMGMTVDVAYVGSVSRHLVQTRNLNSIPYGYLFTKAAQDPSKFPGGVVPNVEPNLPKAYADAGLSFSGAYAKSYDQLRPYPQYGPIKYYTFDGNSDYNSLQISLQRRFSKGLTFGAAYTYSKTMVTANSDEDWVSLTNVKAYDHKLADFDRPHVLAINYVYDLPKFSKWMGGNKVLSYLTDNFQLSGITQFMSGTPTELAAQWADPQAIAGYYTDWLTAPFNWIYLTGDPNHQVGTSKFDPSVFTTKIGGTPHARTYLRQGGMQNWDMSLFKNIPLGSNEQRYVQLRLEAFNVFNHTNFQKLNLNYSVNGPTATSGPSLSFDTRPAGQAINKDYGNKFGEYNSTYTGVGGPRVVQLGMKLYF